MKRRSFSFIILFVFFMMVMSMNSFSLSHLSTTAITHTHIHSEEQSSSTAVSTNLPIFINVTYRGHVLTINTNNTYLPLNTNVSLWYMVKNGLPSNNFLVLATDLNNTLFERNFNSSFIFSANNGTYSFYQHNLTVNKPTGFRFYAYYLINNIVYLENTTHYVLCYDNTSLGGIYTPLYVRIANIFFNQSTYIPSDNGVIFQYFAVIQVWNANNYSVYYKPLHTDCPFEPILYNYISEVNLAYRNTDACVANTNAISIYHPGLYQETVQGFFTLYNGDYTYVSSGVAGRQYLLYPGFYEMTFKNENVNTSQRLFNVSIAISQSSYIYTYNQLPANWTMFLSKTTNILYQSTQVFSPVSSFTSGTTSSYSYTGTALNFSDFPLIPLIIITLVIGMIVVGFLIIKYRTDIQTQNTAKNVNKPPPTTPSLQNTLVTNSLAGTQTEQGFPRYLPPRNQFCSVCGEFFEPGDNYCANCGAKQQ